MYMHYSLCQIINIDFKAVINGCNTIFLVFDWHFLRNYFKTQLLNSLLSVTLFMIWRLRIMFIACALPSSPAQTNNMHCHQIRPYLRGYRKVPHGTF